MFILRYIFLPVLVTFFPLSAYSYHLALRDGSSNIGYAYRQDQLHWSIAGPDNTPNVLSELSWKDLKINEVTGYLDAYSCDYFYIKFSGSYGKIFSGENRDSDYWENDREEEFSRSINNAGKGEVFNLSGALGYELPNYIDYFHLTLTGGYAWNVQHLWLFDGMQIIPVEEEIEGLNSSYHASWFGPWVGFSCAYDLNCLWDFFGDFEYHFVEYEGRGHWNLRTDFISDFSQNSTGHGVLFRLGFRYLVIDNLALTLTGEYSDWHADGGRHKVTVDFPAIGPAEIIAHYNGVFWRSFAFSAYLTQVF